MNTRTLRMAMLICVLAVCDAAQAQFNAQWPQAETRIHSDGNEECKVSSGKIQLSQLYYDSGYGYAGYNNGDPLALLFNDSPSTQTIEENTPPIVLGPGELLLSDGHINREGNRTWASNGVATSYVLFASTAFKRSFLLKSPPISALNTWQNQTVLPLSYSSLVLPDDPAQLAGISGLFLDGAQEATLTPRQVQALDAWVAAGGLLFLDPAALKQLQGATFLQGVRLGTGPERTLDLAPLRDYVKPLVPAAMASTSSGYSGYGYGNPKTPQKEEENKPASRPVVIKPVLLSVAPLEFSEEVKSTLQTTGEPVALASWRYGKGIVSVQAFIGAGDEELTQQWVALQLSRSATSSMDRSYPSINANSPLEQYITQRVGNQRQNNPSDMIRYGILGISQMPGVSAVWSFLLLFPVALFIFAMGLLFVKKRRWTLAIIVLSGIGIVFLVITFAISKKQNVLATVMQVTTPLPQSDYEMDQVQVQLMHVGNSRTKGAELALAGYPLAHWDFSNPRQYAPQEDMKRNLMATPLVETKPRPTACWNTPEARQSALVQANVQVMRKKTGEVKFVIAQNDSKMLRGTIINETGHDLSDVEATFPSPKGALAIRVGVVWKQGEQVQFSMDYATGKTQNCVISSRALSLRRRGVPIISAKTDSGMFKAQINDSKVDSKIIRMLDRPTWKHEERYLVQPLYCDARHIDQSSASQPTPSYLPEKTE